MIASVEFHKIKTRNLKINLSLPPPLNLMNINQTIHTKFQVRYTTEYSSHIWDNIAATQISWTINNNNKKKLVNGLAKTHLVAHSPTSAPIDAITSLYLSIATTTVDFAPLLIIHAIPFFIGSPTPPHANHFVMGKKDRPKKKKKTLRFPFH